MSEYESIEPQFDLASQEQAAIRAELAERALALERLADAIENDKIEKEALEAEKAALEPVPEVPGKVEQEPEIKPEDACCGNPEPHAHQGGDPIKVEMVSDTPEQTVFKIERADG